MDNQTIVLTNEDGEELNLQLLDVCEYEDKEYAILMEVTVSDEAEIYIFEVVDDEDGNDASYYEVEDDDVLEAVFEIFKDEYQDVFQFE
ncbi:MAG: DUF1292 domain-containing protein [Erysipelotrichaceae bacterium]|nr:DUF1292 domain-containing protein [Erysipelotrichaceae bacterium]